jgi:hypothetical protein
MIKPLLNTQPPRLFPISCDTFRLRRKGKVSPLEVPVYCFRKGNTVFLAPSVACR